MSLTIPSQVRGSDYLLVDNHLEPRPSIWRLDGTGYKFITMSESGQRQEIPGAADGRPRELNDKEVLSYNFTAILQMDIQAGDVLGFWLMELMMVGLSTCPFCTNLAPLLAASHPSSLPTLTLPVIPHQLSLQMYCLPVVHLIVSLEV